MSAQDELPPGWTWAAGLPASESRGVHVSRGGTFAELAASTWEVWEHRSGITREEYTAMRAAVERCAELETALAKVTAERDEARRMAETRLHAIESMRRSSLRYTPARGDR